MKRGMVFILAVAILLGAFGVMSIAADNAVVAIVQGTSYASLQLAVDAVTNGDNDGTIQLINDAGDTEITGDIYIDLNGKDISAINVTNGTCYVIDSQTADFTVEDSAGYGTIKAFSGDVQPLCSPQDDGCGWLMVDDEGENASFHYLVLQVTDMVLQPKTEGEKVYNPNLYYKCAFKGDEVVAQNIKTFGVALSVAEEPTAANLHTMCGCSVFKNFQPGANGNPEQSTGTILKGIMKETNASFINSRNANYPIYGRAYAEMVNGEYIFGECRARTLKEQTESANMLWTLFDTDKKEDIRTLYQRYRDVMQTWNLSGVTNQFSDVVEDAVTWYDEFMNLPIVSADMSEQELRQLAVDAFRLQLSYKWTPNAPFNYLDYEDDYTTLPTGTVYVGTPYCMSKIYYDTNKDGVVDDSEKQQSNGIGSSNLFKILKYYDPATGVLDIASMGSDSQINNILINNCSGGLSWALGRVSNNHSLFTSNHYVPANGALPVGRIIINEALVTTTDSRGEIVYGDFSSLFDFASGTGKNPYGQKKADFYKSYAELQPGDILMTNGHVRMCTGVYAPRDENGTLIYGECYAWYIDQNSYGSTDRWALENGSGYLSTQSNGVTVRNLGGMLDDAQLGTKITFQQLLKDNYIPLTIPEFLTEEEIVAYKEKAQGYFETAGMTDVWEATYAPAYDKLIANRGIEAPYVYTTSSLYTQTKLSPTSFYNKNGSYQANYVISDFRVTIEDKNGNPLEVEYPHVSTGDRSKSVSVDTLRQASTLQSMETLTSYAGKGNKLKIETRLSTGQWYTAIYFEIA